ncbi:MAG: hypothetical protein AB2693_25635, partial [Candidatus Thiodiazotropha sp.]
MNIVTEKKLGVGSVAISSLSLLFNIIALAITTWTSGSTGTGYYSTSYSMGLWKVCTENKH